MMSKDQAEVVKTVYNRFIESEGPMWGELDDNLEFVEYLSDKELIKECQIKFDYHSQGVFRCFQDHEHQFCMAPLILESVDAILSLFEKTGELHEKNRYILSYYCSMSELRMIYVT